MKWRHEVEWAGLSRQERARWMLYFQIEAYKLDLQMKQRELEDNVR